MFHCQHKVSKVTVIALSSSSRYNKITNDMETIYSSAAVPDYKDKSVKHNYEPGLVTKMAESTDPEELEYYWHMWRKATGDKGRKGGRGCS